MIKKIKWSFLAIIAALSMASCSSDEPGKGQDENDGGDVKYLAVQIVTPTASGSRASQPSNPEFEVGTDTENSVDNVRFYFFSSGGDVKGVKKQGNNYINYYDWPEAGSSDTPTLKPGDNGNNPHTSKILNAILVVDPRKGDVLPELIVAVVNPNTSNLGEENLSLDQLRAKTSDFASRANDANGKSVMCNSVYMEGAQIINATKLKITDFKKTDTEAINAPVDIYVERNVAKVRAKYNDNIKWITLDDNTKLIQAQKKAEGTSSPTKISVGKTDNSDQTDVYIKVNGWQVTSILEKATLSKYLGKTWNNVFPETSYSWNDPENKRSYWALSTKAGNTQNKYPWDWMSITKQFEHNTCVYVNENADRENSGLQPTVIIVSATLCDQSGNALTICEYGGLRFKDDTNLTALKNVFLTYYHNIGHVHYKKVTKSDGSTAYRRISSDDIEFKQYLTDNPSDKNYTVYATLTADAQKSEVEWYQGIGNVEEITDVTQLQQVTTQSLITCLKQQQKGLVYTSGQTYYFANIEHYTKDGVVRNHIYDIIIDGFYGLGTPIFDKDWEIIPQKPESNEAYLAARINILSWHAMTQHVEFD